VQAAAEELRKSVRAGLHNVLTQFVQQLPPVLNDLAPKAASPDDRKLLTDLARQLPGRATRWVDTFLQHVDAALIGGVVTGRHEPDEGGSADDSIALAGLELRAEERYQKLITELDARFNRVRLMMYVPVYTRALAPASLVRALVETADAMAWPPRHRRILLERFDAAVVPQLEQFYRALIAQLRKMGTEAAKAAGPAAKPATKRVAAPTVVQAATQMQAPADTRRMDSQTLNMLESLALKADGEGYTDGLLAADLLALSDGKPLPGVQKDQSWIPLQRITLAGHFLNTVISDAMVPADLRPEHESVRFPLMKSALTDDTLFTSSTHPLGSLIHELLLKSATSRVTGNRETRRMAELLQQVLVQFDLAPEFVRQTIRGSTPIGETQIQRFFELQRQQAQQRRDFVIAEAKRVVVKQLEQSTFARPIPATAIRFLNTAWGPLLTKRLLQHGAESAQYKGSIELMDQLLDQLEARAAEGPAPTEWKQLLQTLGHALVTEGLPTAKVTEALESLEAARRAPLAEAI
jgi:hypothetical protein